MIILSLLQSSGMVIPRSPFFSSMSDSSCEREEKTTFLCGEEESLSANRVTGFWSNLCKNFFSTYVMDKNELQSTTVIHHFQPYNKEAINELICADFSKKY